MCEDKDYGCDKKENRCADRIIITVIALLFIFVIGVIVGANTGLFDLIGLAGFVVIAVALGVLFLIRLAIYFLCNNKRKC